MIDTHCHLNDFAAFPDAAAAVQEALNTGVDRLTVVGIDEEWSARAVSLAEQFARVYATVGHHPNSAADFTPESLARYREWLGHPKVVALGEIGLDYHWNYASRDQQFHALTSQMDLAEELQVPVVFHCREAYPDLLDFLEARPPGRYLFHCFAGDERDSERALALGAMIGVDGPLTYKKADALRNLISSVPSDRLLIETDAPWLTPEPFRGKPNHPKLLPLILARLAEVRGESVESMESITTANAERFFGLSG